MKLIADLRERASVNTLCELFNIKRSSYYDSRQRKQTIDIEFVNGDLKTRIRLSNP